MWVVLGAFWCEFGKSRALIWSLDIIVFDLVLIVRDIDVGASFSDLGNIYFWGMGFLRLD